MTIDQEATEFATLLFTHAKGRAHDKATAQLREAVEAVKRTGKSGYVAVKFAIDPVKDNYEVVRIQSHVTSKVPEEAETSMWYADDDGALHRNDPNQRSFWDNDPADGKSAAAGKDNS